MTAVPDWWLKPRRVAVVVDNPSWITSYAQQLVTNLTGSGEQAKFVDAYAEVPEGAVAYYLGCLRITPPEILMRNRRNLIVHASNLPKGRGFSPLTWQILEGRSRIPICLIDAAELVDSGAVVYRDWVDFAGHELIDELRDGIGAKTIELCMRFLAEGTPPKGEPQTGVPSTYGRRRPADSRLDPTKSIVEQFNLLRVVDNQRYPAWFEHLGHQYRILVEKLTERD
jgi:methionyl-tRNA formyltransferase